ncbi:MAG: DUF4870 domain-containing protein [Methanobacteriota archaeon]
MVKTSMNIEENVAGLLCYIGVWVTGLIFYFAEKQNKIVRFHAMQSILTFLPLTIISWVVGWIGAPRWNYTPGYWGYGDFSPGIPALVYLSWILWVITVILWLVLMIKAYQGQKFKLPIIGDIAEKHA